MAKNLLQDMVKRRTMEDLKNHIKSGDVRPENLVTSPNEGNKVPEQVKSMLANMAEKRSHTETRVEQPLRNPEPVKIPEQAKIPIRVVEKKPEPIKAEPEKYESQKTSNVETKFASVYDVATKNTGKGHHRYRLWIVAGASALFLLFALSFVFAGAKISINPKIKDIALSNNFSAIKDGSSVELPFELVAITGEENREVQGGEKKNVTLPAKGTAIIYNNFSSAAQPLAIDTRLEGSNGKIYKTLTKLTVPGMKGSTPGSIEASIYASAGGEEYNSGPLDFKIFGFKGTPKYDKFYARSKGDITGGFKGETSEVGEAEKIKTINELKVSLRSKLYKKAIGQIPSGFILWENASVMSTDDAGITFTPGSDNKVTVNLKGTFSGFLFEEKKLTAKIAEKILPKEGGTKVEMPNLKDMTFALLNKESVSADAKNISFNLAGNLKVIWQVDENKLVAELLGQKKSAFNGILAKYPDIDSASLVVRPFWKRSLPGKATDIKTIVNYPK